jgi:hypothetical protein
MPNRFRMPITLDLVQQISAQGHRLTDQVYPGWKLEFRVDPERKKLGKLLGLPVHVRLFDESVQEIEDTGAADRDAMCVEIQPGGDTDGPSCAHTGPSLIAAQPGLSGHVQFVFHLIAPIHCMHLIA